MRKNVSAEQHHERIDRRDDLEPVQSSRNDGKDANKHPMNADEGLSVY